MDFAIVIFTAILTLASGCSGTHGPLRTAWTNRAGAREVYSNSCELKSADQLDASSNHAYLLQPSSHRRDQIGFTKPNMTASASWPGETARAAP